MTKRIVLALVFLFGFLCVSKGQDARPIGYFLKDSVKIGKLVAYSLSYKDKKNRPVIFPDSTFSFAPFELLDKSYFDTKSDTINSIDSAVYYLTTFEIDTVQRLALPVYIDTGSDSVELLAVTDSIILNQVVTQIPDSVNMAETKAFQPVSLQFNYPYWIIGLTILGIISIIVLVIWGVEIRKRIRLYRLSKQLAKFQSQFDLEIEKINQNISKPELEKVLKFWKGYMEKLEDIPYTKLTTKEIIKIQQNTSLEETLKSIDRNIYSTVTMSALQNDFEFLKDYSLDRYNHVTEVIRNNA